MPARSTPSSSLSLMVAAATAAPVLPALTTASASPVLTKSTETDMEEFFFFLTASSPDSFISTTSAAGTISTRGPESPQRSQELRTTSSLPTR